MRTISYKMLNLQKGMGFAELLISLLLGSLIMTALMNSYLNTKQYYLKVRKALEQSYELQLVSDLIRDSIRRAGFTPCQRLDHLTTLDRRNGNENLRALEVSQDKSSLQINRMSEYFDSVQTISPMELVATKNQILNPGRPVLIADCYHAEIQLPRKIYQTLQGQKISLEMPLAFSYQEPVYIGEWFQESFFIKNHKNKHSLFYQLNHADELTAEIQSISTRVIHSEEQMLVRVILGLVNGKRMELDTSVRAL